MPRHVQIKSITMEWNQFILKTQNTAVRLQKLTHDNPEYQPLISTLLKVWNAYQSRITPELFSPFSQAKENLLFRPQIHSYYGMHKG